MKMVPGQPSAVVTEKFPAVDLLKFIFAILIMCLHGDIFKGSLSGVYFERIIVRLAVPFFFVCSGYFYGKKIYAKKDLLRITKSYIGRLALKLLIFEPVAVLLRIIKEIALQHTPVPEVMRRAALEILFYPRGALWYIQAVIIAILLLAPFIKKGREVTALVIGLLLYSFALLCNRYYFLCEGTVLEAVVTTYMRCFISARNGVFVGFLYVSMGVLIAKQWETIQQKKSLISLLMIISGLCLVLEVYLTNSRRGMDDNSLFLSHLICIPSLFICAGCGNFVWMERYIHTPTLRNLSTSIYLMHSPVLQVIEISSAVVFNVYLRPWQATAMAGTTVALICFVIYRQKRNPFYNWIK